MPCPKCGSEFTYEQDNLLVCSQCFHEFDPAEVGNEDKIFDEKEENPTQPPLERNATPEEVAFSFLFLASQDSSQITGQVLHPNGGLIVNG